MLPTEPQNKLKRKTLARHMQEPLLRILRQLRNITLLVIREWQIPMLPKLMRTMRKHESLV